MSDKINYDWTGTFSNNFNLYRDYSNVNINARTLKEILNKSIELINFYRNLKYEVFGITICENRKYIFKRYNLSITFKKVISLEKNEK